MALVLGGEGERGAAAIREGMETIERLGHLADARLLVWAALGPLWLREAEAGSALIDRAAAVARAESAVGVGPTCSPTSHSHTSPRIAGPRHRRASTRRCGSRARQGSASSWPMRSRAWPGSMAGLGREASCRAHLAEALAISRASSTSRSARSGRCSRWAGSSLSSSSERGRGGRGAEAERARLAERGIDDVDIQPAPDSSSSGSGSGAPGRRPRSPRVRPGGPSRASRGHSRGAARARALVAGDEPSTPGSTRRSSCTPARPTCSSARARSRLRRALAAHGPPRGGARASSRRPRGVRGARRRRVGRADAHGACRHRRDGAAARAGDARRVDAAGAADLAAARRRQDDARGCGGALFPARRRSSTTCENAYRKLAIHSREELREALRARR